MRATRVGKPPNAASRAAPDPVVTARVRGVLIATNPANVPFVVKISARNIFPGRTS